MRLHTSVAIISVVGACLTGCSELVVTRIPAEADLRTIHGRVGALPKPYVQVTPQSDGSIKAEIVYLADPTHQYAFKSKSYLATDSLDVVTSGGVIQSVNWSGDSSAVVAQAVTSAGAITGTMLQAERKQDADRQTQESTAAKALADARLALLQAQADYAIIWGSTLSSNSDKLKAQTALSDAALKVQAAEATLRKFETGQSNLTFGLTMDGGTKEKEKDKDEEVTATYGPMLFVVDEELQQAPGDPKAPISDVLRLRPVIQTPGTPIGPFDGATTQPQWIVTAPAAVPPKAAHVFPTGTLIIQPTADIRRRW